MNGIARLCAIELDALGTVVWRWGLNGEAFDDEKPNEDPDGDNTAFVLDLRFPGQQYDSESGFSYNYFRDYDAATGRYVQSDPIGLAGGVSTYGYVGGNPLAYSDPYGLQQTRRFMPVNAPGTDPYSMDDPAFQRGVGNILDMGISNAASIFLSNPYVQSFHGGLKLFSRVPGGLTLNQKKFWRRYCAGTDDPCNAIKTAVTNAIFMAREKQARIFHDDRKLYLHAFSAPNKTVTGTNTTWLNHVDDLYSRTFAIQEMIAVGKALGCDMSEEERLASYIFVPKKPFSISP